MKHKVFMGAMIVLGALVALQAFAKPSDNRISGQYIVVFKDSVKDVDGTISTLENKHHTGHLASYHSVIKGFAATMSADAAAQIATDPSVEFVSEDRTVTISAQSGAQAQAQTLPNGIKRIGAPKPSNSNIAVAVIDTGVDLTHPDLNVGAGITCVKGTKNPNDDNGHGTHVAGIIGAKDNTAGVVGVAAGTKIYAVKVLNRNGSGSWSDIICGLDWVTSHASALKIKVANMSLGGGGSSDDNCGNTNKDALHKAICRTRDAGVTVVVAAGNESANTSVSVPAAYNDAVITVSALADSDGLPGGLGGSTGYGADDTFASFSNFGTAVDVGAPGVSIYSTYKGGSYATLSGTSMASPHVAGVAALYAAAHPGSPWTQVRDGLISAGEAAGVGAHTGSASHPEKVVLAP